MAASDPLCDSTPIGNSGGPSCSATFTLRTRTWLEHGSILPGLVSLADFIVAASEFAVNEVERRFRIYGNLKHLSSLSKSAFVTKDVAKIFRNVDFMWRGRESLLEDLDSGFGCDSRIEQFVNAKAINWNGANDIAIAFVVITEFDAITAKEVRIVADSLRKAHVDVAIDNGTIGTNVYRCIGFHPRPNGSELH